MKAACVEAAVAKPVGCSPHVQGARDCQTKSRMRKDGMPGRWVEAATDLKSLQAKTSQAASHPSSLSKCHQMRGSCRRFEESWLWRPGCLHFLCFCFCRLA